MKRHPEGYVVKLVRDGIADMLGGDGTVTYRPLTEEEHVDLLRGKLLEEAVEYLRKPGVGELADILETIQTLAQVDLGVSWSYVLTAAAVKRSERGSFREGIGMVVLHPADLEPS